MIPSIAWELVPNRFPEDAPSDILQQAEGIPREGEGQDLRIRNAYGWAAVLLREVNPLEVLFRYVIRAHPDLWEWRGLRSSVDISSGFIKYSRFNSNRRGMRILDPARTAREREVLDGEDGYEFGIVIG